VKFINSSTGTAYRLVVVDSSWRVTKSREDAGQLRLAHLRGDVGDGAVDDEAVAQLVAGQTGVASGAADPQRVFAAVILADLEGTATVLVAIAKQAAEVYEAGCPGFRPRSRVLREQRDRALAQAAGEMKAMAKAWIDCGLVVERTLPDWLTAALEDEKRR